MITAIGPMAAAADAVLLAALHGEAFPDDPWNAAAVAAVLAMPGAFAFLHRDAGDAPAGFAIALDSGEVCEILALGVRPAMRRRGVAAALLDHLAGAARERGRDTLLLEVAEDNAPARALYGGRGFAVAGRRPDYYRRRGGAPAAALLLRRSLLP